MASYNEEFKKRIVRMHLEEGRTIKSLSEEYHVSENGIGYWLKKYREECSKNPAAKEEYDLMKENLKLRKELEEMKKENDFLKKRQHSSRRRSISSISICRQKQRVDGTQMASQTVRHIS